MRAATEADKHSMPALISDRAAHIAWEFSIVAFTLLAIATVLFIARLWTRIFRDYRMMADDYVCVVAYLLVVTNSALFLKSIEWVLPTWSGDPADLAIGNMETSTFYGVIAQPFWAWGMAAVKSSVGLMLLRLEHDPHWRRFLWAMIAFQLILSTYTSAAVGLERFLWGTFNSSMCSVHRANFAVHQDDDEC